MAPGSHLSAIFMTKYKFLPVTTHYWRPGDNYLRTIVANIKGKISDGDFVVVSEKAISTALNNIIDENRIKPTLNARLIAAVWMRDIWGYLLGPLCRLRKGLIRNIREYPDEKGSHHKQVALRHAGLLQALMFGSEGGIDGSNLPYTYVSRPLKNAGWIALMIRKRLQIDLGKNVSVMIVDTDKTYSISSFHFTPRPRPMRGIHSLGGVISYVVGRFLKLRKRATPLAISGSKLTVEDALHIAELADHARGFGAGRTVWEMADMFHVGLNEVSWQMLEAVKHKPIIIVRKRA
jgi:F420-0:gamma-glutamyl ligase-like protein